MGARALHAVIGWNSRRYKELEPSRRLSEMIGPQSPTRSASPSGQQR